MTRHPEEVPPAMLRVVEEIRMQSAPDLDWDKMEGELLSEIERGSKPRYRTAGRSPAWLAGLSVAAAAVLGLSVWGGVSRSPSVAPEATVGLETSPPRNLNGADLEDGQRLTTGESALSVNHPGLGRWVLEARSSGEVRSNSDNVVVQLQSGSLSAKIIPSVRPETFVVEVGKLRVAVHGTEFSVRRDADQAYVEVREGVVAVSSPSRVGQTLLEAPASGRFHLTGDDAGRTLEASGSVHPARAPERQAPPKVSPVEARVPNEPTFSDVEAGLAKVERALQECLKESTNTAGKVRLSLHTRVTLRIDASGKIRKHEFSPPLAPELEACAQKHFESVQFAASVIGAHVIRDLSIRPE